LNWRKAAVAGLVFAVALNAVALMARAWFVHRAGPYAATTGYEEFNIYHVWKVVHGFPLYEWPQKDHYVPTHYNVGFYHVYAWWVKLWHQDGAGLVNCARTLTALFALFGMWVQVHLTRRLVPAADARTWVWGLAFLTWFGAVFGGWWVMSVRPDMPGVAIALAGLTIAWRAQETRRLPLWLLSSLLFFGAWSFKQSIVWIFVGTVAQVWLARVGWRAVVALVAPFAVLAATTIWRAGEIYRYSLFVAPQIYEWYPLQSLKLLLPSVSLNTFFWWLAALAAWRIFRDRSNRSAPHDPQRLEWRSRAAALTLVPPLVMGLVQTSLQGSNVNNLLEGFVLVALLGSAAWLREWNEGPSRRRLAIGATLLATMGVMPVVHLVLAACDRPYIQIAGMSVGNVIKLTPAQLARRQRFAQWMQTLPKPICTLDAMLQLPWFSNNGRYPALLREEEFEYAGMDAGTLEGEGIIEYVRRRYFGTLLLYASETEFQSAAEAAGYVKRPLPPGFDPFPNEFGVDMDAPIFFVRGEKPETMP
jgi:hypothetical protein